MKFEFVLKELSDIKFDSFRNQYCCKEEKDSIIDFVIEHREQFLDSLYCSELSKPAVIHKRMYRLISPEFLNYAICGIFKDKLIVNKESEGVSYDWLIFDKKISVKFANVNLFDTSKKKGQPIQLKNTLGSIKINEEDFDYLFVFSNYKDNYGLYVYTFKQIEEILSNKINFSLSTSGFDTNNGQIKIYLQNKEKCFCYVEMDKGLMNVLINKYAGAKNYTMTQRNEVWNKSIDKGIKKLLKMTKDGKLRNI